MGVAFASRCDKDTFIDQLQSLVSCQKSNIAMLVSRLEASTTSAPTSSGDMTIMQHGSEIGRQGPTCSEAQCKALSLTVSELASSLPSAVEEALAKRMGSYMPRGNLSPRLCARQCATLGERLGKPERQRRKRLQPQTWRFSQLAYLHL